MRSHRFYRHPDSGREQPRAGSGCSLLVDHSTAQCKVDADCLRFGGHPICQSGVCVAIGARSRGLRDGAAHVADRLFQRVHGRRQHAVRQLRAARAVRLADHAGDGRSDQRRHPAAGQPGDGADAELQRCAAPTASTCTARRTSRRCCSAAQPLLVGRVRRSIAPSIRTRPRAQGVISVFDSTKRLMTNPAAGATPNYAFYFDDSGSPDQLSPRHGRQHHRHRRLEPVLDDVQHLDRDLQCRARP